MKDFQPESFTSSQSIITLDVHVRIIAIWNLMKNLLFFVRKDILAGL